ncbi:MAG: N-acetylmuramoyl-L-alanine amidase [Paraclostridium sp.]
MKYFVDFGHGGADSGAVGGSSLEKNINKLIGERVVYHLKRHNQSVLVTRENDDTVSLDERVRRINTSACDLGISIHCNSFTDNSVRGLETYTWGTGTREIELAKKVHNEILSAKLYEKNRGIKQSQFRILSPQIPCCLVETAFISNDLDKKLVLDNIENFAVAITKGLLSFYGISYKAESGQVTAPGDGKYYRVQIGAYSNKENAEKLSKELQQKGYSTMIKYY